MIWATLLFTVYMTFTLFMLKRLSLRNLRLRAVELYKAQKSFQGRKAKRDRLFNKKTRLENDAARLFTLYEISRELAKTFDEGQAFRIFEQKMHENLSFQECFLLDPEDEQVEVFKNQSEYHLHMLKSRRRKIGYLVVRGLREEDYEKVAILAGQFTLALRRIKLYKQIEKMAITDSLTGLNTRRYTLERLYEEFHRSRAHSMPLAFLMIDVDHFKRYNDRFGHLTGDKILAEIGRIVADSIREIDIAGRFGGEEFCVVLPDTDYEGARYVAERIRQETAAAEITVYDHRIKATVSIGMAGFPKDAQDAMELIDKADWTLYKAKKQGRNRVCCYDAPEEI